MRGCWAPLKLCGAANPKPLAPQVGAVAQRGGFRYDAKALRRADPNKRRRWLIPLVLAAQVPFCFPPSWPPKCSPACDAIWLLVSRTRCLPGCWPLECKSRERGSTGAARLAQLCQSRADEHGQTTGHSRMRARERVHPGLAGELDPVLGLPSCGRAGAAPAPGLRRAPLGRQPRRRSACPPGRGREPDPIR